jgi:hypothetical protein
MQEQPAEHLRRAPLAAAIAPGEWRQARERSAPNSVKMNLFWLWIKRKKIFETPSHCVSGPAIKATVKPSFFISELKPGTSLVARILFTFH